MKTKSLFSTLLFAVAGTAVMFNACSKDDERITETDITLAQDEVYIDALYNEVDNLAENAVRTIDLNDYRSAMMKSTDETPCVVITVDRPDDLMFPKIITIDYGEGCSVIFRDDTITYRGQIIITVTERFMIQGAQRIVTFNDFYINGAKIEGIRTITNLGLNDEGHHETAVRLENGKITFADGSWISRDTEILREWIRKEDWIEDTIYITGSSYGTNALGEQYVREISEPVMMIHCYEYHYRWVRVAGTVTVTNSQRGVFTIDFGDGTCEGALTMNKFGERHNLRFRYRDRRI
ncbi:MAG: hypothetical protein JXB19_11560 [Bacteroidales bacterium]|nr:hypothetical protein [Bacteroidales bacterium]